MSAIAGYVGNADPGVLEKMLDAVSYRGDKNDTAKAPGVGIGYRMWSGRPGKSGGVAVLSASSPSSGVSVAGAAFGD